VLLSDQLHDFDVHCPLATLPLKFKTTPSTVPNSVPYLFGEPGKIRQWRDRLTEFKGLKVGLVWAGSPGHGNDRNRSIALGALAPLAGTPTVTFVSLQKGKPAEQAHHPSEKLHLMDWTSELLDFADTAALIECLDLVIAVDTSTAHLAGAIGKPVWLLLPFVPDWRWMLDRPDSPWYPTMRLFRQPSIGDWTSTIHQVAQALRERPIAHS